jgi:hypothetical protein
VQDKRLLLVREVWTVYWGVYNVVGVWAVIVVDIDPWNRMLVSSDLIQKNWMHLNLSTATSI